MSAPMVSGILALWLEANPNLDPATALTLLKANAKQDAQTGNIPSNGDNNWGWGKIDAYATLANIVGISNKDELLSELAVYPNPTSNEIFINSPDMDDIKLSIKDLTGRTVLQPKSIQQGINTININSLANGLYLLVFEKDERKFTHKIMVHH